MPSSTVGPPDDARRPGEAARPDVADHRVVELVGIYHANGSLWGEVSYWVGARFGRAHCALCDITHGTFRRRPEWDACAAELPVPFTTCHLDDRPDDLVTLTDGRTPCVVARTAMGPVIVVDSMTLEACGGQPGMLVAAIGEGLARVGAAAGEPRPDPTYTSGREVPPSGIEESS